MKIVWKRDWDGFLATIVFLLSSVAQLYCIIEGMKLSKWIFFTTGTLSVCYFLIWIMSIRHKRHARIIMGPDDFTENDYFTRTGISGRPWPRARDQWDARRNTWDTGREGRNTWRTDDRNVH